MVMFTSDGELFGPMGLSHNSRSLGLVILNNSINKFHDPTTTLTFGPAVDLVE